MKLLSQQEEAMMKSRNNLFVSLICAITLTGLIPLPSSAKDIPLWKFELVGEDQLLSTFDDTLEDQYQLQKNGECYFFPMQGKQKDKWGGFILFCKRTPSNLNALTNTFTKLTVPQSTVPLEMTISSLSGSIDCGNYKCSRLPADGGACGATTDSLGNLICKHRLHDCAPK